MTDRAARPLARLDRAWGGYPVDVGLYALFAAFALATALTSTLLPHRAWGAVAAWAYAAGAVGAAAQLVLSQRAARSSLVGNRARATLAWLVWTGAALLPLLVQAVQRAGGRAYRAQEEVLVVERMGERLLHDGTPYLSRAAIAALPADERLMAYSPYQPGMAIFGLPEAAGGVAWWTDARIWFAVASAAALIVAMRRLHSAAARFNLVRRPRFAASRPEGSATSPRPPRQTGDTTPAMVRALQAATVLPVCALTLATGGDDIPVLALCLLALALAATDRYGWSGLAVGAAAAGKLFAIPVVAVLAVLALATGNGRRFLPGALGLPILVLIPPILVDPDAFVENVLRFPLGHGLVTSPAQSPFPGHLIAQSVPAGRLIAAGLLVAVAALITVRILRRPPRAAHTAAALAGWGLLAAILLMPTTRFGYLLYPAAFLAWAPALRAPEQAAHSNPTATTTTAG